MADSVLTLENFIGGKYAPPVHGNYIDSFCPATGPFRSCQLPNITEATLQER